MNIVHEFDSSIFFINHVYLFFSLFLSGNNCQGYQVRLVMNSWNVYEIITLHFIYLSLIKQKISFQFISKYKITYRYIVIDHHHNYSEHKWKFA